MTTLNKCIIFFQLLLIKILVMVVVEGGIVLSFCAFSFKVSFA